MKNLDDMRSMAIKALSDLKSGNSDAEEVDSFCKICNVILNSLKVEIDYKKKLENGQIIEFINQNSDKKLLNC